MRKGVAGGFESATAGAEHEIRSPPAKALEQIMNLRREIRILFSPKHKKRGAEAPARETSSGFGKA